MYSLPNRNRRSGNMSRFLSPPLSLNLSALLSTNLGDFLSMAAEVVKREKESWTSEHSHQKQIRCPAGHPSSLFTYLSKLDLIQSVCLIYTAYTGWVYHLGLHGHRQKVYVIRSVFYFENQLQTTVSIVMI